MRDYAELARLGGASRARITQIMSLRHLAPAIQERILAWPEVSWHGEGVNERLLRGMAQRWDWREQMRMWEKLESALGHLRRGGRGWAGIRTSQPTRNLTAL